MKSYYYNTAKINLILLLFGFFALYTGCKKVNNNDKFLHTIYSVITDNNLYRANGTFFHYQYIQTGNTLVAGDTLTIAGILGGSNVQREVKIGNTIVTVFNPQQYRIYNAITKDTVWANVDYLQCKIPKGETGNNVAVTITVNGSAVNAPSLKIQEFTNIQSATDTTLLVEKVAEWLPSDLGPYQGTTYKLWENGTVTNTGNVWFYNKPQGIFKTTGGSIQQVLAPGASITPVSGTPFQIQYILGFTIDLDETVIYFSASTTETTSDNALYYITRFCKMDPASGAVTVLNRSTYMKRASQYPRAADLTTLLYTPANNYLPAEGNLTDARITLTNMHLALDGTLFATNFAYPSIPFPKSPLAGNPRFPQFSDPAFYATQDSVRARAWYGGNNSGNITNGINNFIRIRGGVVKSLAKQNVTSPVPALSVFNYSNQQLSSDGKYIYSVDQQQRVLNTISTDDFESTTKGIASSNDFSFSSLDKSAVTGLHTPAIQLDQDRFATYYILSNGDGVFFPSPYRGVSLLGINFTGHNAYAYAGTEKGLNTTNSPGIAGQDKTTGLAKWVNFSPNRRVLYGINFFIGFDRKNNLYFASTATQGFGSKHLPLEIYRIKKP